MRALSPASFAAAALIAACGQPPVPEAPPPPAAPAPPPVVSPARWSGQRVEVIASTAARRLPGGVLHGSDDGDRWIARPAPAGDGGAPALFERASMVVPDGVAGILPVEGRWAFFGASGRVFLAASPLGAIDEVREPPVHLQRVSAGGAAAVGIADGGGVLRTADGGAHWSRLEIPGLAPAVPFDLALQADGTGVLLAAPQRVLGTADDGATWAPIPVPTGSSPAIEVSDEGEIWHTHRERDAESMYEHVVRDSRLQGKPPRFVPAEAPVVEEASYWPRGTPRFPERAVGGKHLLSVGLAEDQSTWQVAVADLDRDPEWRTPPELHGCRGAAPAAFGDDLVLGCARPVDADGGLPAGAAPFRAVFLRSSDGGASWAEDGEAPLWQARWRVVAGPDGAILLKQDCPDPDFGCVRLALRPARGRPFAALSTPPKISYYAFAFDPVHRRLLAVGDGGSRGASRVEVWSLDGRAIRTTTLFDRPFQGDMTLDERGDVVIVAVTPDGWRVLRSPDGGDTFASQALSPDLKGNHVGLAGDRGLLMDGEGQLWETASAGRTWVPVTRPSRLQAQPIRCAREGCALGNERRLGWDLPAEGAPGPALAARPAEKAPDLVPGAPPIRCAAGDLRRIERPLASLDALLRAAPGGAAPLAIPVATKAGGVDLLLVSASEGGLAVRPTPLVGPAPPQATTGSRTEASLWPAGVVVTRATYPVDGTQGANWLTPVSSEVAWWRPEKGKVVRARLPPHGKGEMSGRFSIEARPENGRDLLWLAPEGLYYRPRFGDAAARDLHVLGDDGRASTIDSGSLPSAEAALRTPAGLVLLSVSQPTGQEMPWPADHSVSLAPVPGKAVYTDWRVAPPPSPPQVEPLSRGEDGAIVVAWSGPGDAPARAFVIPLRPGVASPEMADLPLGDLLVARPPACADGQERGAALLVLPLPRAARRPVLLEASDGPTLALAESVIVRVPPRGRPCVSAWIASDGHGETVHIPVASPSRSWSFDLGDDLVLRARRCEEAPGLAIPASLAWKGF